MWRKGGERAATLPPAAVELYGGAIEALRAWAAKSGAVTPPTEVAEVVEAALTAETPADAATSSAAARGRGTLIGRAPDRARDRLIARLLSRAG